MIGLGSNRLSVCRRGGMSVTQFGMAGMSRTNDFFGSPYSAQATAALKDAFPTQWSTIRDYGFAHPALVPFINEDPMLVMSLIDGLGTRWLVGDGEAYIKTGVMTGEDIELIWDMVLHTTSKTSSICGARINGNSNSISQGIDSQCWVSFGNNSEVYWSGIVANQRYSIKQNKEGFWIDGTKHNYQSGYTTTFSTPLEMYLMGRNNNNQSVGNICDIDLDKMIINNNGVAVRQYYPFICKARTADKVSTGVAQAAGTCGMIDLLTGIFYSNANSSGSFTISEPPAS